jgi:hypothetical protein
LRLICKVNQKGSLNSCAALKTRPKSFSQVWGYYTKSRGAKGSGVPLLVHHEGVDETEHRMPEAIPTNKHNALPLGSRFTKDPF